MAHDVDGARKAVEAALAEVFTPQPILDADGKVAAMVCKRGRAVRITRLAAEYKDPTPAINRRFALALGEAEKDYLDSYDKAKRLAEAYRDLCAQAGVEYVPARVPRCGCGFCVGYRPYDDLLAAEHALRVSFFAMVVPTNTEVPTMEPQEIAEVKTRMAQYLEVCTAQGETPRWQDVFFGGW